MRDERGFEEFAAARTPELLRHAYLLCGDPGRAADLVEHGLAAAYRHWPELGPDRAADAADRAVLRRQLSRRGRSHPPATTPGPAGGTGDVVWRALAGLPVRRRAVLVLRYADALADADIAGRLGVRPELVAAEAAAGLTALTRILRGRGRPEDLLPAALADPPAPDAAAAGAAAAGADGAAAGVRPTVAGVRERVRRGRRRRTAGVGVLAAAAVAALAAVAVPAMGAGRPAGAVPATVPAAVPGLLSWPARGSLVGDADLLRAALAGWQSAAADRPAGSVSVLYAGEVDGARLVLLQGLDEAGHARVAEVAQPAGGGARLVRTDPIGPAVAVLVLIAPEQAALASPTATVSTAPGAPTGSPALLRLLGPPADGDLPAALYLRAAGPLRRLGTDATGLSEPVLLAGPAYVAVVGGSGPGGGVVGPAALAAGPSPVAFGSATLPYPQATGATAGPDEGWYADGQLLAARLGGPVEVAPLGPGVRWRPRSGPLRGREFRSQAYEVVAGGSRLVSVVVRLGGRLVCAEQSRLGAADAPATLMVLVRRCPGPHGAGLVHVLAGPGAAAVRLTIAGGAGRRTYRATLSRPAGVPPSVGYVAVALIPADFPLGAARAEVTGRGGVLIGRALLAPYRR